MRTYRARFDVSCSIAYHLAKTGEDVADVLGGHARSILHAPGDPAGSAAGFGRR